MTSLYEAKLKNRSGAWPCSFLIIPQKVCYQILQKLENLFILFDFAVIM
jgi:hypothetical protein